MATIRTRSRVREMLLRLSAYLAILIALILTLFPVYWIAANSFKFDIDIFAVPPEWLPAQPDIEALRRSVHPAAVPALRIEQLARCGRNHDHFT